MVDPKSVAGYGKELSDIKFTGTLDWLISFNSPGDIWKAHPSFLICQFVYLFGATVIFIHALKQGGRWPFLFAASILQGLTVESLSYLLPDIDNFWHAQGLVMFFGKRLPLYVAVLYPVFYYHSFWAALKLKLKCKYTEYIAIGLLTVLMDIAYDIVGIKYLHWVWHDTDPNIADRHMWVPWNSYYFHCTFAISFAFFFEKTRNIFKQKQNLQRFERGSLISEIAAVIAAGVLGMPGGCLLFIPLYHPLHDFLGVPTEVTTTALLIAFVTIFWKFDRKSNRYSEEPKSDWSSKLLYLHLVFHFGSNLVIPMLFNPSDIVSVGLHEPVGNCNELMDVQTVLKTLSKRKYLCVTDYDEKYFDFHCLPKGRLPKEGSVWYTLCGTAFENKAEFITVITLIMFVAFMVLRTIHFDCDLRIIKRLPESVRKDLLRPPGVKKIKQK